MYPFARLDNTNIVTEDERRKSEFLKRWNCVDSPQYNKFQYAPGITLCIPIKGTIDDTQTEFQTECHEYPECHAVPNTPVNTKPKSKKKKRYRRLIM